MAIADRPLAAADAVRVSLEDVPPRDRLARWNEISGGVFGGSHIEAPWGGFSRGEMVRLPLGGAELVFASSSPARVTRRNASNADLLAGNTVLLEFICAGRGRLRVSGRDIELQAGDYTLLDPMEAYRAEFREPIAIMVAVLPTQHAPQRLSRLAPFLNRPIRPRQPQQAVLSQFFRAAAEDLKRGYRREWGPALLDTIWGLIELAYLSGGPEDVVPGHRLQLRQAAQQFVERELLRPDLRAPQIAKALRISDRYVQMLFADLQTTPSRYIRDRRLEVAAGMLCRAPGVRISEVALAVGFNDLAYFSRSFRRRFGQSAREYQRGAGNPPRCSPASK